MGNSFTIPLVFSKENYTKVDEDLSLALLFWYLENDRDKGGGLIRKKDAENVTQVSLFYRPLLITKYGDITVAFDGCGIYSTQIKYGIAPSLTFLPSYLLSDGWSSKPESYAEGLNSQSQEFEKAREEYSREVRGLITDIGLLKELTELLKVSSPSESGAESLPLSIDFAKASESLAELDKLKNIIRSEIRSLITIKQKINEKTSEVLTPLKRECSLIEDRYNREIEKIRPSVLERKEKIENKRANQRQQIEARFSVGLHELRDRRDAATAKIDTYDSYSGREPRGGIEKQYSIRDTAARRIKELEKRQEKEIATNDEKYDVLIAAQQGRIDAVEERKEAKLEEPRRKIEVVSNATNRLVKAIDDLIENHHSVISIESASNIVRPIQMEQNEFMVYLPTIMSTFDDGRKSRLKCLTASSLKDGKGLFGGLKGLVGVKFIPIEEPSEILDKFAASITEYPKMNKAVSILAKRNDLLRDSQTKNRVISGIAKMQTEKWIKCLSQNYPPVDG